MVWLVGEPVLGILVVLVSPSIVLWLAGRLPRGLHNHVRVYPESVMIPSWVLMRTRTCAGESEASILTSSLPTRKCHFKDCLHVPKSP